MVEAAPLVEVALLVQAASLDVEVVREGEGGEGGRVVQWHWCASYRRVCKGQQWLGVGRWWKQRGHPRGLWTGNLLHGVGGLCM